MTGLLVMCTGTAFTCAAGWALRGRTVRAPKRVLGGAVVALWGLLVAGAIMTLFPEGAAAADGATAGLGAGIGFMGASLATGLACLGAGIAVAVVGAAALGVVGEKPSMLGTTLIYLGLAEGIAIYGVIVSLLILGKL